MAQIQAGVWHEEEEEKEEKEKEKEEEEEEEEEGRAMLQAALGNVSTKISHLHAFLLI